MRYKHPHRFPKGGTRLESEALRCQEVGFAGCCMTNDILEMARSVGLSKDTRIDETRDNENLRCQSSETVAIGDAWRSKADIAQGDECLLDVAEVANRLHVSKSHVYKMIERREIPALKIGRCLRVDPRTLEDIIRSPDWAR